MIQALLQIPFPQETIFAVTSTLQKPLQGTDIYKLKPIEMKARISMGFNFNFKLIYVWINLAGTSPRPNRYDFRSSR